MKRRIPWLVAVALGATLAGCRIEIETIGRDAGEDRDAECLALIRAPA